VRAEITTCRGAVLALPTLHEWTVRRTGSVPCDSAALRCGYDAAMAETLREATRLALYDGDKTAFFGVMDEWRADCDGDGLRLELSARGMAALLLDNEAEAASYQRATTAEILRRHVLPYGIACPAWDEAAAENYLVAGGGSEWAALEGFARRSGLTPQFRPDGTLLLRRGHEGAERTLEGVVATSVVWRDKRHGVLSEIVTVDRGTRAAASVRNEAFLARGGCCRRISYARAGAAQDVREAAEEQLERSRRGSETLTVTVAGAFEAEARDELTVSGCALGVTGRFLVTELVRRGGAAGETTTLTLERKQG